MTTQSFRLHLNTIPQKLQIRRSKPPQTFLFLHDFTFIFVTAQRINTLPDLDFHIVSLRFALIWHPVVQWTDAMSGCPMNFKGIWDLINFPAFFLANNLLYAHKGHVPTYPIPLKPVTLTICSDPDIIHWGILNGTPVALELWSFHQQLLAPPFPLSI